MSVRVGSRRGKGDGWSHRLDLLAIAGILLAGGLLRYLYVSRTGLPAFDPWRHLQLVDNLRRGAGFTLFDGQPYVWYSPVWHRLVAALPESVGLAGPAAACSLLAAVALYLFLRSIEPDAGRLPGLCAGLLTALSGPLVAYTCHYGSEGLALLLTLAALAGCALGRRWPSAIAWGLAYGLAVVLRTNFAFVGLLFVPSLRGVRRWAAFATGAALPLVATWWRNHRIIAAFDYVFTWDGLATRSADFSPLSTLVVQLHPSVQEALRRLHELIIPQPEWLIGPSGVAWPLVIFLLTGLAAVVASRRWELIVTTAVALLYFLVLDRSMSSHFFRIYLPLFPVLFLGVAHLARSRRSLGVVAGLILLLSGAPLLAPPRAVALEEVTPPAELLVEDAFMVNSGFYHPETLVRRFPEKRFIGMPLDVDQFEALRQSRPDYDAVLWHEFSVQPEILRYLRESGRYRSVRTGVNAAGRRYTVWRAR